MRSRSVLIGLAAAVTAAGLAFAAPGPGMRHRDRGDRLERLAQQLDLTDGQKARIKEIFEEHRAKGLGEASGKARAARRDLRAVIHDPAVSDEAVRAAAQKAAAADADVAVERHRAFAEAFTVLTPEQQEKAKQLREQRQSRYQ